MYTNQEKLKLKTQKGLNHLKGKAFTILSYYNPHFNCAPQLGQVLHPPLVVTIPSKHIGQILPTSLLFLYLRSKSVISLVGFSTGASIPKSLTVNCSLISLSSLVNVKT